MMQLVNIPFLQKQVKKKKIPTKKIERNQFVWTSSEDGRIVLVYIAQCTCQWRRNRGHFDSNSPHLKNNH